MVLLVLIGAKDEVCEYFVFRLFLIPHVVVIVVDLDVPADPANNYRQSVI